METKDEAAKNRGDRLEELALALKEAQLMLLKQSASLEQLSHRDPELNKTLAAACEELAVVTAERDQLQKQLLALERMQIETIALPEGQDAVPATHPSLASIQELMADLYFAPEESGNRGARGHSRRLNGPSAEAPETDLDEMIAPEVIAPEVFGGRQRCADSGVGLASERLLVYMDMDHPVKVPLLEGTMTVGRSESASIRIDGPFISRIHARIICSPSETVIVDAGSTNGFKINSIAVERHTLKHGDVLTLGSQRFTFIDLAEDR